MTTIYFERTSTSKYANQGMMPSGEQGYNVWIEYPDDEMIHFLGFCTRDQIVEEVEYYKACNYKIVLSEELK